MQGTAKDPEDSSEMFFITKQALSAAITPAMKQDEPFDKRQERCFTERIILKNPRERENNAFFNIVTDLISPGLKDNTRRECLAPCIVVIIAKNSGVPCFVRKRGSRRS